MIRYREGHDRCIYMYMRYEEHDIVFQDTMWYGEEYPVIAHPAFMFFAAEPSAAPGLDHQSSGGVGQVHGTGGASPFVR